MKKFLSLTNKSILSNSLGFAKSSAVFILLLIMLTLTEGTLPIFEGLGLLFGIGSIAISSAFCNKTTLFRVVPISYKKRVLYYYLDIVIFSLIGLLIFWVGILIIFGIFGAIAFLATGESIFVAEKTEAIANLTANAHLFSFFKSVLMFAVLSAIARLEKTKHFNIAIASFVAVYFGGSVLLANLVKTGASGVVLRAKFYELFETLPLPWLAVVLCAVLAVGAAIGSVAFVIYKEKPKAF
ncbi:MAG: hypothetical protein ACI4MC_06300 [Candidatus Coproplasma sp.]